jgi:hypothetical protein
VLPFGLFSSNIHASAGEGTASCPSQWRYLGQLVESFTHLRSERRKLAVSHWDRLQQAAALLEQDVRWFFVKADGVCVRLCPRLS